MGKSDVVILDLNQQELALRIAEAITGTQVRDRCTTQDAMARMQEDAEDLYLMVMDAAHEALMYFSEKMNGLNEQTQRLSGEDMVKSVTVHGTQH